MIRKKIETFTEQKLVIAMIMSKEFLLQASTIIDPKYFKSPPLQTIAKWCLKYYTSYKKAPKKEIESLYGKWVEKSKSSDEVKDAVARVLESLSKKCEEEKSINVPYLVDTAQEYIRKRRLEELKDEIQYQLGDNNVPGAVEAVNKFSIVSTEKSEGINVLSNDEAWDAAFSESMEPLITWRDKHADRFFGHQFVRDSLVGILAPPKRGKTWWCVELTLAGLMNRKKVAMFQVGDMSQSQVLRRFGCRLSYSPLFKSDLGEIRVPSELTREGDKIRVKSGVVKCENIASASGSRKAIEGFLRANGLKKETPHFMLSTHPNYSINVKGIENILLQWKYFLNFVPDVLLIDYPDILANEDGTSSMQARDQINTTWKMLRRLSQTFHCCVIVPTQANAEALHIPLLRASNFAEDKRKLAHVTAMIGLNQTPEEKKRGLMRLNFIMKREEEFSEDQCLHVGQCLKLGLPFCCSIL